MPEQVSTVALLGGVTAVALGIFGVLLREHWNRTKQHDDRLRALEQSVATKADVTGVYERLNTLGDRMNEQHSTILRELLALKNGGGQ